MIKKICQHCGKVYCVPTYRDKISKFCSSSCNLKDKRKRGLCTGDFPKGNKPWNKDTKGVMKAWNKGKKLNYPVWNKGKTGLQTAWNKGKPWDEWMAEDKKINALINLDNHGDKHWNWKGGITPINRSIRQSKEYKDWRMKVFQRDRFACQLCGYRSVKRKDIRADHIKPFSLYPELRFEVSNGRTLCVPCDLKHGWQLFRENNPRQAKNEK
jgi:hypothetical protein